MPLQALEPQRLYRQIAEQLQGLIRWGEFVAGSRLPAERDLARQLGVSRPSVREAFIALEVDGWVEVRMGSGVYVLDRGSVTGAGALGSLEWGPLELIRARRVVEGEVAALAAAQAKRRDIDAISRAITHMRNDADQGVLPLAGDRAFHSALAQATGNSVLVDTVHRFWDARGGPLFTRLGGHFETVPSWRAAIAEHDDIAEAVRAHDSTAARKAMHAHMDRAHRRFTAGWRRNAAG